MTSGSKRPALFTCIDEDNKDLHVIVKLRGALPRDSFSCVAEYVSSVLANDLRLESGEVVAVEVSQDLAQAVYDAGQVDFGRLIDRSIGLNVGSIYLGPGFSARLPSITETVSLRGVLTRIFGFDFVIQNFDRQVDNPNYLIKGSRLVLIDHEQAFGHLDVDDPYPFSIEKLNIVPFFQHVSFSAVDDLAVDFHPFFADLAGLPDAKINNYVAGLPPDWLDKRAKRMADYLSWARSSAHKISEYLLSLLIP